MNIRLLSILTVVLLSVCMQSCKPDPPVDIDNNNDPDSLYIGTTYTIQKPFRFAAISNNLSMTYEGVEIGRRLFYDKRLSSTGQLSCASCHKPEHSFSDAGNSLSINVNGITRRNTPGIINLLWNPKMFWDGRVDSLSASAKDAFHGEQGLNIPQAIDYLKNDSTYARLFKKAYGRPGTVTEDRIYNAMQQFMATLISSNSKFDKFQRGEVAFTESELHGLQVFTTETGDCLHCHSGEGMLFTDRMFRNNALDTATDKFGFIDGGRGEITGKSDDYGKFKSPTLRNIALTAPYMHDGRFKTLEDVIDFYSDSTKISYSMDVIMLKPTHNNGQGLRLSPEDKQALIDFLHTLTDTSFINNPAFQDPFQ